MVKPGTILLDKYRIERVLGKGGMGVVALAHHLQLDVPVAIKFLLPDVLIHDDVVRRFLREAQAAVKLKSEHVSRIIDVGTLETGAPYMVMEYLEGTDLGELLRAHGRLATGFAVDLVLHACEALAEAHALGIVHRDIKPSNFFLTRSADGAPLLKILDFGISKAPRIQDEGLTSSHAIIGTPAYMSPEQMQSSKHVDPRTDIWALGVVLYELVTGRRPFGADNFAGLVMVVASQPMRAIDDVELPAGLADIIERCLAKNPADRFQSTAELVWALAPYAGTPSQAARSVERTARMLGLAKTPPLPALPRARADEPAAVPTSTVRESAGEHVTAPMTHGGVAPHHGIMGAAAPGRTPPLPVDIQPRRRRGPVRVITASLVLGAAVSLAIVMLVDMGDSADTKPASGNAPSREIDGGVAAPSMVATPVGPATDAGVTTGIATGAPGESGEAAAGSPAAAERKEIDENGPVDLWRRAPATKTPDSSKPAPGRRGRPERQRKTTERAPARSLPLPEQAPAKNPGTPGQAERARKTLNPFDDAP